MMSPYVTCHVTAMSRASSSSLKEKEKEIQKKRNIKSRKIDKRKRKILVSPCSITLYTNHILLLLTIKGKQSSALQKKLWQLI